MQHAPQDHIFHQNPHFLSTNPLKSPPRNNVKDRKSSSPLRGSSLVAEGDAANGRHSLAHELAAALMPEPSATSRLLSEEFGIEYDEGAEGIDDENVQVNQDVQVVVAGQDIPFANEFHSSSFGAPILPSGLDPPPLQDDLLFGAPPVTQNMRRERSPQDSMELLAQNLESTDKFLAHLRTLDTDPGSSSAQQPALERIASDVIRRINETTRDREGQVRELLECEREFRKIAGEVGGTEVLGRLEELAPLDDSELSERPPQSARLESRHTLEIVEEEPSSPILHRSKEASQDWETDPDRLGDDDDDYEPVASPVKDSFPPPPPITGYPTPATTIPQLTHLRSFTTSIVTSLATISEQAQVNGAATTEAGRKIRALKNKLGGWRTDWDNAERSRLKITRWEAGLLDGDDIDGQDAPTVTKSSKRIDGRRVVEEHLRAFELALADAALKTQAIMAAS